MKILYVHGDSDYAALMFEQNSVREKWLSVWELAKKEGGTLEPPDLGYTIEAYEFGEIDPEFINFLITEIIDEDDAKHANFYVVEEASND